VESRAVPWASIQGHDKMCLLKESKGKLIVLVGEKCLFEYPANEFHLLCKLLTEGKIVQVGQLQKQNRENRIYVAAA